MCMCPLGKGCVTLRASFIQAFHNYMVAQEGVGAKLAEEPVITKGEKELVQWGIQFYCPVASVNQGNLAF